VYFYNDKKTFLFVLTKKNKIVRLSGKVSGGGPPRPMKQYFGPTEQPVGHFPPKKNKKNVWFFWTSIHLGLG
jgi:hypothetical protein